MQHRVRMRLWDSKYRVLLRMITIRSCISSTSDGSDVGFQKSVDGGVYAYVIFRMQMRICNTSLVDSQYVYIEHQWIYILVL